SLEQEGQGNLAIAFDTLKRKLKGEGLFSEAHKKQLPKFPKKIAIVTSPTGAAIQDMLKIITSKNNIVNILQVPVLVQGDAAAKDITKAIKTLNEKFEDIDVMIVGRGGGSTEDLWAFNEEILARAIFDSEIPVISAVGHQTDFTIADFVADVRAETPTAAADMAVPNTEELLQDLQGLKNFLDDGLNFWTNARERKLINNNLDVFRNILEHRVMTSLVKAESIKKEMENDLFQGLREREVLLERNKDTLKITRIIENKERKIQLFRETIHNLGPQNLLNKGYSITINKDGKAIKSIKDIKTGDEILTKLSDGTVTSTAN
ncbi:MAG: exodeoxyribonuclease VII large subunit, partial [Anaerovoracaceae bacterium]